MAEQRLPQVAEAAAPQVREGAAPPIKTAPFDLPHIPLYFWVGGIAAGSWIAATAEELSGGDDRDVVRAGRYLSLGSILAGSVLLIADLGRPERFLNMLRVFRARSAMSLGSWALAGFGGFVGLAALLQASEDGWLGPVAELTTRNGRWLDRSLHVLGAPVALFVGSYTGVLLSATASPSWAHRARLLPALFSASSASSGIAAVGAALELTGGTDPATARRLARAQSAALGAELALEIADRRPARQLPSAAAESATTRTARWLTIGLGMALPLALSAAEAIGRSAGERRGRARRRSGLRLAAAGLTLAGSLAMRWLTVKEGLESASTPEDTWRYAGHARGEADDAT